MRSLNAFAHRHHWFAVAEHGLLRTVLLVVGFALIVLGLGLGVTMIMLPVGVFVALAGVGAIVLALTRDVPLPPDA